MKPSDKIVYVAIFVHYIKGEDFSIESLAKELGMQQREITEAIDNLSDAKALTWSVDLGGRLSIELLAGINYSPC